MICPSLPFGLVPLQVVTGCEITSLCSCRSALEAYPSPPGLMRHPRVSDFCAW